MKIVCVTEEFTNAFGVAQRAATSKSVSELANVLLQVGKNSINFTGYDLSNSISTKIKAVSDCEGGFLVSSERFGEYINKLPCGEFEIDVDESTYRISLKSLESKTKLATNGLSADKFPRVSDFDVKTKFSIPCKVLKEMLSGVSFCASTDATRPILTGCNLTSFGGKLDIVAVDGFRLALRTKYIDNLPNFSVTIPSKSVLEISKSLSSDKDIEVSIGDNNIMFSDGDTTITSTLLSGDYIDYQKLFTMQNASEFDVDALAMYEVADRSLLMTNSKSSHIAMKCEIRDNEIAVSTSGDYGVVNDEVSTTNYRGENVTVLYNSKYIKEIFKNIGDEICHLECGGASKPLIITPTDGDAYKYLVLPVRAM